MEAADDDTAANVDTSDAERPLSTSSGKGRGRGDGKGRGGKGRGGKGAGGKGAGGKGAGGKGDSGGKGTGGKGGGGKGTGGKGGGGKGGGIGGGHGYRRDDDGSVQVNESKVNKMLTLRMQAQGSCDFATADSIQIQLSWMGVEVVDRGKTWRAHGEERPEFAILGRQAPEFKAVLNKLPLGGFAGEIVVIPAESHELIAEECASLRSERVLGFDTETKPNFKKGAPQNPICLVQLASHSRACLFRLQRGQPMPPPLRSLLEDEDVLKIGIDICTELKQLGIGTKSAIELRPLAIRAGCRALSLQGCAAAFLGIRVIKGSVTTSNWEAPDLSREQCRYAATDAWACRAAYDVCVGSPGGGVSHAALAACREARPALFVPEQLPFEAQLSSQLADMPVS